MGCYGYATHPINGSVFLSLLRSLRVVRICATKEIPAMVKRIARKLVIGATLAAVVSPAAFAAGDPLGTDPEPGVIHTILVMLGLQ
jgi:hypothetical protein